MQRTVYLFRHGQVEARYEGCCRGIVDAKLSIDGEAESRRNADFIVRQGVQLVITSGLRRSDRVGELAAPCGTGHQVDRRFAEQDFGEWEGRAWEEIRAAYPREAALMRQYAEFTPPQGESPGTLRARVHAAWVDVVGLPWGRIAIVGHGFMNVMLLSIIEQAPYRKIKQEKGCVNVISLVGDRVTGVRLNCYVADNFDLVDRPR